MQEEVNSFKMENRAQSLNRISSKRKHLSPLPFAMLNVPLNLARKQCTNSSFWYCHSWITTFQHFKPPSYIPNNCCISSFLLCFQICIDLSHCIIYSRWDTVMWQIKTSYRPLYVPMQISPPPFEKQLQSHMVRNQSHLILHLESWLSVGQHMF